MPGTSNTLLVDALRGVVGHRRPVWMMRQAGRYLPEYRAIREKTDFLSLCRSPDLAAEVTIQPVDIVGVDAAIIFSDILVIPEAMGMELKMEEGKGGPRFPEPLKSRAQIDALQSNVPDRLEYVYDVIRETVRRLDGRVPVIGFAGAPLTLAAYMVEGHGSKTFNGFKSLVFGDPDLCHSLLERLADELVEYMVRQVDAGAEVLQLFDSWAGILPEPEYREFGLRHARSVLLRVAEERPDVPLIFFPRGVRGYDGLTTCGAHAAGIDWQTAMLRAVRDLPEELVIQGNLDPAILLSDRDVIERRTLAMLESVPRERPYVVNLGHGIDRHTPVENARHFVETVQSYLLSE